MRGAGACPSEARATVAGPKTERRREEIIRAAAVFRNGGLGRLDQELEQRLGLIEIIAYLNAHRAPKLAAYERRIWLLVGDRPGSSSIQMPSERGVRVCKPHGNVQMAAS